MTGQLNIRDVPRSAAYDGAGLPSSTQGPEILRFEDRNNYDLYLIDDNGPRCLLTMSVAFVFEDSAAAAWQGPSECWRFLQGWVDAVEQTWSLPVLYFCPQLGPVPFDVRVDASFGRCRKAEWTLRAQRIPAGDFRCSYVSDGFIWNTTVADSEDLTGVLKGASHPQRAAVHEFGHMIGLSDEYPTSRTRALQWTVPNRHDVDSIMHSGEVIRRRHHATFRSWVRRHLPGTPVP